MNFFFVNFFFFCSEYYVNWCVVVFVFLFFFQLGLRTNVVDGNKTLSS